MKGLPKLSNEPAYFDILGSSFAIFCVQFVFTPKTQKELFISITQHNPKYKAATWCENIAHVKMPSTEDSAPANFLRACSYCAATVLGQASLPRFLGGPCTLGQLTLFTPNISQIINWQNKNDTKLARQRCSFDKFDENCYSEIFHWSHLHHTAMSVFLPWVAAAKALVELGTLECWVAKQANLTSTAISDLLEDETITRKAALQNRAAIDYLLLLHNRDC